MSVTSETEPLVEDEAAWMTFLQERRKATLTATAWDETEHPRHPAGDPEGGEFAPKQSYYGARRTEGGYQAYRMTRGKTKQDAARMDFGPIHPEYQDAADAARAAADAEKLIDWSQAEKEFAKHKADMAQWYTAKQGFPPDYFEKQSADLWRRYQEGVLTRSNEIAQQLAATGVTDFKLVPQLSAAAGGDLDQLGDTAGQFTPDFYVDLKGDPGGEAPGFTIWTHGDGTLEVEDVLDITDTDFFPEGPDSPLVDRYVKLVDAARGNDQEGFVTLHRGMTDAEADEWNSGGEIPLGKFFTSIPTVQYAQDRSGAPPALYTFKVPKAMVTQVGPNEFQLKKRGRLRQGEIEPSLQAAAWSEAQHTRHPAGDQRGGEFAPKGDLRGVALIREIDRQRAERAKAAARTEPEYDERLKGMWSPDADEYIFDPDDPYFTDPVWKAIKLEDGTWKFWITNKLGAPHHDAVARRLGYPSWKGELYSGGSLRKPPGPGEPQHDPELHALLQRHASKWQAAAERATAAFAAAGVPYTGGGGMVCLYPDPAEAEAIAREGGQPAEDLHVTLLFYEDGVPGYASDVLANIPFEGLTGEITGIGRFKAGEDGVPVVGLVSAVGLNELRTKLAERLPGASEKFGFVPHMTLGYDQEEDPLVVDPAGAVGLPVTFNTVKVKNKDEEPVDVLTAAGWNESAHPRHPAGSDQGGEFASKGDETQPPRLGVQPEGGYVVSKAPNLRTFMEDYRPWLTWMPNTLDEWPNVSPMHAEQLKEWLNRPEIQEELGKRGMSKERREAGWVLRDLGAERSTGTFPESAEFRKVQQEMADHVIVEGYNSTVEQHIRDLTLFPEGLLGKLGDRGTQIFLGTTGMAGLDQQGFRKGVRPRGWPGGFTWDRVAGGYDPMQDNVILGVGHHGSASLALHETAHAIDEKFGVSDSAELKAWHKQLFPVLGSYEKQRGYAGRQEFWAESVAAALKSREQGGVVLMGPFRSVTDARAEGSGLNEWVLRKLDELAAAPD